MENRQTRKHDGACGVCVWMCVRVREWVNGYFIFKWEMPRLFLAEFAFVWSRLLFLIIKCLPQRLRNTIIFLLSFYNMYLLIKYICIDSIHKAKNFSIQLLSCCAFRRIPFLFLIKYVGTDECLYISAGIGAH